MKVSTGVTLFAVFVLGNKLLVNLLFLEIQLLRDHTFVGNFHFCSGLLFAVFGSLIPYLKCKNAGVYLSGSKLECPQ